MSDLPINTAAMRKLALAATQGERVAYEKKAYDEHRVYIKVPGQVQKLELFKGGCPGDHPKEDCDYIAATAPAAILLLLDELDAWRASALATPAPKPRAPRKPKAPTDPLAEYFAEVDPEVVKDFKAMRLRQKAEVTPTALKGFVREAEKAGMTLQAVLAMCCERGWRGFRADWVAREQAEARQAPAGRRPVKFDPVAHINLNALPRDWDDFDDRMVDVTPR
ncbi:hypothetical protein D0T23_05160 [Duganella sp. BJB475]|nr:hypothetical protein D0T23_05160 [Duganella sp. BJB475]